MYCVTRDPRFFDRTVGMLCFSLVISSFSMQQKMEGQHSYRIVSNFIFCNFPSNKEEARLMNSPLNKVNFQRILNHEPTAQSTWFGMSRTRIRWAIDGKQNREDKQTNWTSPEATRRPRSLLLPSGKATLESWGSGDNSLEQRHRKETEFVLLANLTVADFTLDERGNSEGGRGVEGRRESWNGTAIGLGGEGGRPRRRWEVSGPEIWVAFYLLLIYYFWKIWIAFYYFWKIWVWEVTSVQLNLFFFYKFNSIDKMI